MNRAASPRAAARDNERMLAPIKAVKLSQTGWEPSGLGVSLLHLS